MPDNPLINNPKPALRILIIRLSSIGDIMLTTPVVRCLYLQKNVEIHFLTKAAFAPILAPNPYIKKIWIYDKGISSILRQQGFDYIIDLHKNFRTFALRWAMAVKSFSFPKLNLQKWLLVRFKINKMPKLHIIDRYLQAVAPLGVHNDGEGMDCFIDAENHIDTALYGLIAEQYLVLVVGAAHATKALPYEQMERIAKGIQVPLVLIGGKEEAATGEKLAALGGHIHNLCGRLSLLQSASVLQQARLVISPDTGMMHIAAALRRPIVSVWGSTVPAFGMYPYYPTGMELNTFVEHENLSCRPCSKIGFSECPKGHFKCMRELDMDKIIDFCKIFRY